MIRSLRRLPRRLGFEIVRSRWHPASAEHLPTTTPTFRALARQVLPFTMTSVPRLLGLYSATRYVARKGLPGAIVECGVWRGGSMMLAAGSLLEAGVIDRELYLFDTFEGMTAPTGFDVDRAGADASALLMRESKADPRSVWCVADLDDVRANMLSTGYPDERVHYVRGRVEETLPAEAPAEIALLRLDTDWYESTRHELIHLFPRIVSGGVLIVDDYGHWEGARRAVDEYLAERGLSLLLVALDQTGVCATVP